MTEEKAKHLTAVFVTAIVARVVVAVFGIYECVWLGTNGYGGWPVVGMALLTLALLPNVRYSDDDKEGE